MRNILITGANGYLGSHIIKKLLVSENYNIFAFDVNKNAMLEKFGHLHNILYFDTVDWENDGLPFNDIDVVVHCAFARAIKGEMEITTSVKFTNIFFNMLSQKNVPYLINISSQEVYGNIALLPWNENTEIAPNTIYGASKYFTELLANNLRLNSTTITTNIRLAGLIGYNIESRMVSKFVECVIEKKPMKIIGGDQVFSQIDIWDAVDAICIMIDNTNAKWRKAYNLGSDKSYNIIEIATTINKISKEFGLKESSIILEKKETKVVAELDSCLLYNDFNWLPKYNLESTVKSIFEYKLGK